METAQEIRDNGLAHYVPRPDLKKAITEADAGRQHHARGTLTVAVREIYTELSFFIYPEDELRVMLDDFLTLGERGLELLALAERHRLYSACELINDTITLSAAIRSADQRELTALLAS